MKAQARLTTKTWVQWVLVASLAALAVGCGGGGSAGGGSSAGPAAGITAANQTVVAQDTLQSTSLVTDASGASPVAGAVAVNERVVMQVARSYQDKLPTYFANAPKTMGAAVSSQTYLCAPSGSMVVSVDDADNSGALSTGDSVSIAFSNCGDGTVTVNGSLGFAMNSLVGALGSYPISATMTMSFGNFVASGPGVTVTANGSVTVADQVAALHNFSRTVSVPTLTFSANLAGVNRSRSLSNSTESFARAPDVTDVYHDSYSVNGTVTGSNTLATVTVSVTTVMPFVRRMADAYPYTGQLVLTGMNNSKLRITAMNNTNVQLEVDADGNGSYESSNTVLWSALMN